MRHLSIDALAEALVAQARGHAKTASAAPMAEPAQVHPLSEALKEAAAALRASSRGPTVSLAALQKVAAAAGQPGTGAQSPAAGNGSGATAPALPGLRPTNFGVTAGGGGAPETLKQASTELGAELRKIAADLRERAAMSKHAELERAAHVLNAAVGILHLQKAASSPITAEDLRDFARSYGLAAVPGATVGAARGAFSDERPAAEGALRGAVRGGTLGGLAGMAVGPTHALPVSALAGLLPS